MGRMEKPDVEYIEGLSPAISIDQKTTSKNPRSTVGTVTEIHDYLRLLYARIGIPLIPCVGIGFSTIYMRYHYGADVLAGFVLAALGLLVERREARALRAER